MKKAIGAFVGLVLAIGPIGFVSAQSQGPDVIVGDLTGDFQPGGEGPQKFGSIAGVTAYSIGTTSCNVGDKKLLWLDGTRFHPVIGQNFYRLKSGRFEQIGLSWLKHGFAALQMTLCGACDANPDSTALGPGCSDPYGSGLNGSQGGLGPRFEVNAATGQFAWPFFLDGVRGDVLFKRIQVNNNDLDPAQNPGARYFGEGQYVTWDDAQAGNKNNNASYREFRVGSFVSGGFRVHWVGQTQRESPAIQAWQDVDPTVDLLPVDVPDDGRFWVGTKVIQVQGRWTYNYAIHNLSSDRSLGDLTIPIPAGVTVTGMGFHDIDYHSGEPYDPTDWSMSQDSTSLTWSSPDTFAHNPDTNALRWGTLYTFWFTADTPPTFGDATLGLFKPGTPAAMIASIPVPSPPACPADIDGDGDADVADFFAFVSAFAAGDPIADINGDGTIDVGDFFAFVAAFAAGCA